ncbi:hypothetical protein C0995_013087 [Termitomyces sp. Mi166|nr:hypothetical protein C0995_013087 [Termitomyces sp. Mi166\
MFPIKVPQDYYETWHVSKEPVLHPLGGSPIPLPLSAFTLHKGIQHPLMVDQPLSSDDITKMNLAKRFPSIPLPNSSRSPSKISTDEQCRLNSNYNIPKANCRPLKAIHKNQPWQLPDPGPKNALTVSGEGKCKEKTSKNSIPLPSINSSTAFPHSLTKSTTQPRHDPEPVTGTSTANINHPNILGSGQNLRRLSPEVRGNRKRPAHDIDDGTSKSQRHIDDGGTRAIPPSGLRRGEIKRSPGSTLSTGTDIDDNIHTSRPRRNSSIGSSALGYKPRHEMHVRFVESPPPILAPGPKHPPPSKVQMINWANELNTIVYLILQGKTDEKDEEKLQKVLSKIEEANFTRKLLQGSALVNTMRKMVEDRSCKQRVLDRLERILHFWAESKLL